MFLSDPFRRRSSHRQFHVSREILVSARRRMHVRTRMYAAGLIISIMAPFGGLLVPENSVLSRAGVFSFEAQAAGTIHARASVCRWNVVDWQAMSDQQKNAWQTLGWNEQMWESDAPAEPASNSKAWAELSENERTAAQLLGYRRNTWDADNCAKR
jgi:hypothetical protein